MEEKEFVQWLKENALLDTAIKFSLFFEDVYKKNLNLNGEKILIIGDLGSEGRRIPALMLACYFFAAKSMKKNVEIIIQDPKFRGDVASEKLIEKLFFMPEESIIVLCMSGKIGSLKSIGRSFRKYAQMKKHKFISLSGLNFMKTELFPSIVHSLRYDPNMMKERGERVKEQLDKAIEVRITTDEGTDVVVKKKGVKCVLNSGLYNEFGTGGNLPAGEVYFHPEGTVNVNGKVVVDGSIRTHEGTIVLRTKVELIIEEGKIVKISGGKEAKMLEDSIEWAEKKAKTKENVRKIAEIGIGLNPNARILGPTIIDEKTLGTAHIANGSNHWFGGPIKSSIHYDHVFKCPKIYADGKLLKV